MERLLRATTAYAVLNGDFRTGRLSHAYLLHLADEKNLRYALKVFALAFFGTQAESPLGKRILSESYTDCIFCPEEGKKITAEAVSAVIEDSALRPVEGERKLYVISGFETAAAIVQNKLLKTLEEPPEGVYFLLGATTLSPVLATIKSRVKLLEIPPFSVKDIYAALERRGHSELNARAAESCGGSFGEAERLAEGGFIAEVCAAAEEICAVTEVGEVGAVAAKYGDVKYKQELLSEMRRLYFAALRGGEGKSKLSAPALIYALERIDGATADLKFNAYFTGLLYDFILGVCKENEKWSKLRG